MQQDLDSVGDGESDALTGLTHRRTPAIHTSLQQASARFVGRRVELRAVRRLLDDSSLVTLLGVGGIGKSRLALEVARSFSSSLDAVWLADLSEATDDVAVVRRIGDAMGLSARDPAGPLAAVLAAMGIGDALLVLDECEWSVGAAATAVEAIRASSPRVRILATSRSPLNVRGERIFEVPPLDLGPTRAALRGHRHVDAVELFLDRTARSFDARDTETARLAWEICRALDGLPLAIELVAASTRQYSLREILARLRERPSLLDRELFGVPARQRSIRATIDWSLEWVGEDAARLFAALAVFHGGFDRDAVAAVAPTRDPIVADRLLDRLIEASLLRIDPSDGDRMRFEMLEPIRHDASERLATSVDEKAVRRRHAAYFARLAHRVGQALDTHSGPDAVGRVRVDAGNLAAAVEWSLAHDIRVAHAIIADVHETYLRDGRLAELRGWLARARADAATAPLSAGMLSAAAAVAAADGEFRDALSLARLATDRTQSEGDRAAAVRAWILRSQLEAPDPTPTRRALAEATQVARELGSEGLLSRVLGERASLEWALGDTEAAAARASEALALAEASGVPGLRMLPATVLARAAMFDGLDRTGEGRRLWVDALRRARDANDLAGIQFCLGFVALLDAWAGDVAGAHRSLREAAELRVIGDPPVALAFVEMVGAIACHTGRPYEGLRLILAKERLAGPDWIDSPGWWGYIRGEVDRAVLALGGRANDARAEALGWSRDVAIAKALEEIDHLDRKQEPGRVHPRESLSVRELELARLIAEGLTNREIGRRLGISVRTVDAHVRHISDKLDLANRAQIAAWVSSSRTTLE